MEAPTLRSHKASAVALFSFLMMFYFRFKLGSIVTATSVSDWYQSLHKASFNPPNGAFSPVWIVLYFLMAISGWLVWQHGKSRAVLIALSLFGIQLAMNLGWSLLFFGMKRIDLALAEILLLSLVVIANTILFWRIDWLAGALLAPYALWLIFASVLNSYIWALN